MYIQVRIDAQGSLRNQRYAFSDRFTLVSELLQNARRAGATRIEVRHDPQAQTLVVRDNGCGIGEFQKLLSMHETGWEAGVCDEEQPFGVGFSKCLYAARRCNVASGRQRVDFSTRDALAQLPIAVACSPEAEALAGTRIELQGVDLADLALRMEGLCMGFPVPVSFNGQALQRSHAAEHLRCMPSAVGAVHLAGTEDGDFSAQTFVYLQGFCVLRMGSYYLCGDINVVHLEPGRFLARLPDRDKLIDEDEQHRRIQAALRDCWRQTLEQAQSRLAPERFVALYYRAMRAWGLTELLNRMDLLPGAVLQRIVGYPVQDADGHCDYLAPVTSAPARAAIETGAVTLVSLEPPGDDNAVHWMLARAQGFLVCRAGGLHADHWAQRHVRHLEDEVPALEVLGEQARAWLHGRRVSAPVILCEALCIHSGSDSVRIDDACVFHQGTLYIPRGEHSGDGVQQAASYLDGDGPCLQSDLEADRDALAALIRHTRSVDPLQTLDSLLQALGLGNYPLLHGRRFALQVGRGAAPGHCLELLE